MSGAIYDAINNAGAFEGMEESEIAQYVSDTSKLFANQVLAEANKRGCSIDGILKASDIKFENGKIRLQAGKETIAETPIVQMDVNAEIVTDDTVKIDENGQTKLFQSAMYKSPKETFDDFYNNVLEKENEAKKQGNLVKSKSYYEYKDSNVSVKVTHDAVNHDNKKHNLDAKQWEEVLKNLTNIENAQYSKTKFSNDNVALIKISTPNGKYGVAIQFANGNNYISTAFKSTDKGIDAWIKKGSANSVTSEPLPSRENSHTVAVVSQNLNNIIAEIKQNLNPDELNQLTNLPKQKKVNRGSYNVSEKAIELFKTADFSTLPHEFAHFWLDNMWEFSRSGRASEAYMNNFNSVLDWLGVKESQTYFTKAQQEKFAKGYEKPQKCTK